MNRHDPLIDGSAEPKAHVNVGTIGHVDHSRKPLATSLAVALMASVAAPYMALHGAIHSRERGRVSHLLPRPPEDKIMSKAEEKRERRRLRNLKHSGAISPHDEHPRLQPDHG